MSDRYEGAYISIRDVTVTEEDQEGAFVDNMRIAGFMPTRRWAATFEGPVVLTNGEDGYTATIVRHGPTPQEAVANLTELVESYRWKVLLN